MKSSSLSNKTTLSGLNIKSKKNVKDREKKRSVTNTEKNELHNSDDKVSPSKDSGIRKYAGIGADSISIYSEQSTFDHISEEVCCGLAEDLSYKLRYIIHDSLIKARLSGRNHILSTDIDSSFNDLNIEEIYGASTTPNWITLGDQNSYYLEDPIVNLVEIAEQECSFIQPGDVLVAKQWLPDTKDSRALKNYFETMCLATVSNDIAARHFALNDIKANNFIGAVVKWFYHFGYFLLSKDITYDSLTLSALSLISSLEQNPIAPLCVCEKQLKLLIRLILQRLLRSETTIEVLKPMCSILAILSRRLPIRELVIAKLIHKIPEAKKKFTVAIMYIINAMGLDAVKKIFIPYMEYLLLRVEEDLNTDFTSAILQTYSIMCRYYDETETIDKPFYNIFGDSLCTFWDYDDKHVPDKLEVNWINVKLKLLLSRKKIPYSPPHALRSNLQNVFPEYNKVVGQRYTEMDTRLNEKKSKCFIKTSHHGESTSQINLLSGFMNSSQKYIIIGKQTLSTSGLTGYKYKSNTANNCFDHSLKYYNL